MGNVATLREIAPGFRKQEERSKRPTGIPAMDRLTAGGIARGTLTEIYGPVSSGRTSFLFAILMQATQQGECCAWIDTAGTFDPHSAAEASADLDRILWVNCEGNTEHALKAVDLLTQGGGFGVIVLDMADTPERDVRRISLASGSGCVTPPSGRARRCGGFRASELWNFPAHLAAPQFWP